MSLGPIVLWVHLLSLSDVFSFPSPQFDNFHTFLCKEIFTVQMSLVMGPTVCELALAKLPLQQNCETFDLVPGGPRCNLVRHLPIDK